MSTSPERTRTDDLIVNAVSRWLAGHIDVEELRAELARAGTTGLGPGQAEAVEELVSELEHGGRRAELEMVARETVEAVALGG